MGPYESAAPIVYAAGLNPLPIAPSAKQPAVKWKHWQTMRMPAGLVERFRRTHGDANIGTTTGGVSGLLVVDIDSPDESFWQHCIDRFGDTPVKVRTASGKLHLWYASPGVARTAQRVDGLPVDIRADRGVIVLPPSIRAGIGEYTWMEGHLGLLRCLPLPKPGSLIAAAAPPTSCAPSSARPQAGQRNIELFRHLRLLATDISSWNELLEHAVAWNETLDEPLGRPEVTRTAASVWHYKTTGRLLAPGGSGGIFLPRRAVEELGLGEPDAVALLAFLRMHHAGRRDRFVVSIRAMAGSIRWSERRLRKARDLLVERGLLVRMNADSRMNAGSRLHQPAEFTFGG